MTYRLSLFDSFRVVERRHGLQHRQNPLLIIRRQASIPDEQIELQLCYGLNRRKCGGLRVGRDADRFHGMPNSNTVCVYSTFSERFRQWVRLLETKKPSLG